MVEISVYDFIYLCCEPSFQTVKLWDIDNERVLFEGILPDMPEQYADLTVQSFDCLDKLSDVLTINITLEDD